MKTCIIRSVLVFTSVPSDLITSISLSLSNPTENLGGTVILTCTAMLNVDVSGATVEFDYGIMSNPVDAIAGITQTNRATISPVMASSAGKYNCTVTITAPGVCGPMEPEPACPTKTSNPVTLAVQGEW